MATSVLSARKVIKRTLKIGHSLFNKHLLITNAVFSTAMGATGDMIQQHYDILTEQKGHWKPIRTAHMSAAGLTTGVLSHYWYILLDRWLPGRCFRTVMKKVLYDQILFSPVNISVYFGTVGILEGSTAQLKEELFQKGSKIYIAEWLIWPPAQVLNFYVLPLRFRVFFDNLISLGFDIYSPYVKYKCQLKGESKHDTD